jgi:kumamolisin
MAEERNELNGSYRSSVPGAQVGEPVDPNQRITVLMEVRRKAQPPKIASHDRVLTRRELAQQYGADPADLAQIRSFAQEYKLQVIDESAEKRTVQLAGAVADLSAAFGVTLHEAHIEGRPYHQRTGALTVPKSIANIVVAVLGLDTRPAAKPRYHLKPEGVAGARASTGALTPLQVASLYGFPSGDGSGQTIAIVELGGGFSEADLTTYFTGLGVPVPSVTAIPVMGGSNSPGVDPGADGEVMLDIEIAGAVAPAAGFRVYFAPNTDAGFLAAVKAAVHDAIRPVAVSISWGGAERNWTPQAMQSMESAFQDAANLGIPVTVAAGDDGSADQTDGLSVDFPASALHAVGCGGTCLQGSGSSVTSETVWNSGQENGATGGGVSTVFAKPSYQAGTNVPPSPSETGGRGVPDVCGNAAAESPYKVRVSGQDTEEWGTSAVAPLWAGLIARLGQRLGRPVGFLNTLIYQPQVSSSAFRDITSGNNDISGQGRPFSAGPGWDACTGLGSPIGAAFLNALQGVASPKPEPGPGPKPAPGRKPRPTPKPAPPTPKPAPPTPKPAPPGPKPAPGPKPGRGPQPGPGQRPPGLSSSKLPNFGWSRTS